MKSKHTYKVIGLMSGTSTDGLDIACCQFTKNRKWEFVILSAITIKYPRLWKNKLESIHQLSGEDVMRTDAEYGKFIGTCCTDFIRKNKIRNVDLVASHGHTIFHQPQHGFTFQLGSGAAIHAATELPVVSDFRNVDVCLGGQGAPLVPIGDRYLFGEFDVCLNLGGIANLSMERNRQRIAFDVCFANMGLNFLARKAEQEFDQDGKIASRGTLNKALLEKLSMVYTVIRKKRPSLGREGFELNIEPLLMDDSIPLENRMITFCQSIADEIYKSMPAQRQNLRVLVTGGGALNPILIRSLSQRLDGIATVIIPSRQIVEFKEAMVFAFLGTLRLRGEVNVLRSVTRARRDSCSGDLIG